MKFATIEEITAILNEWAEDRPFVKSVLIFGSRVRGDNKPDSDLDLAFEYDFSQDSSLLQQWLEEENANHPYLRTRLPGIEIHTAARSDDPAWRYVNAGKRQHTGVGKIIWVLTSPKP